ncbi:unnamed protein product [Nippostrongylus brasiliensis]|uniref:Cytochrome P450 n=1 Tax=Nippostrongylus brasiliensis TaxID=27835 RepID=A0A0N4YH81_NIPBR|nr:unnamed protein product [Nippostrongylus brasiliensis]
MTWITIIAAIFGYFFLKMWIRRRSLPPGPFPLPLVGNIHQMVYGMYVRKLSLLEIMQEWVLKYGKVITFWFGPIPTVNICDHELAVEAMVKKGYNFVDRMSMYIAREEKDEFYMTLDDVIRSVPEGDLLTVAGDLNGHVGTDRRGCRPRLGNPQHILRKEGKPEGDLQQWRSKNGNRPYPST